MRCCTLPVRLVLAATLCMHAPPLHGGAASCDTLALAGSIARAEACYAAASETNPEDADLLFNWGVTTQGIALETKDSAEAAALLRRAVTLYERAVALGGRQQIFLYALADAYCRLNQLDSAVEIYTALNNWRRGLPYNASSDDMAAAIFLAERTVRENRAATTGDKLSKLSAIWEHRFSDDFRIVADRVCEPDEAAHLHAVFQPDHVAELQEPLSRWFYHTDLATNFRARGSVYLLSVAKLEHDMEQLATILATGDLSPWFWQVLGNYTQAYAEVQRISPAESDSPVLVPPAVFELVAPWYNTNIWSPPTPRVSPRALSGSFDSRAAEAVYRTGLEPVVLDNVLSQPALNALLRFTREATIWHEINPAGYLGAYFQEGLSCPLLLQVIEELREALPNVIGELPLKTMWAYKYLYLPASTQPSGVGVHADAAQVNVNLWISEGPGEVDGTPSNDDGMVIWMKEPPAGWAHGNFLQYNGYDGGLASFVADTPSVSVSYRQNRMVLFRSSLVHKTATGTRPRRWFGGKGGNRRINLTFLFGEAKPQSSNSTSEPL